MLPRHLNREHSTLTVFKRAIATHLARILEKTEQELLPIVQLSTTFHRSDYSIFSVVLKRLGPLDDAIIQKCLELEIDTREYIRQVRLVKGLLLFDPDTTRLIQLSLERIYVLLGPAAQTHMSPEEAEQTKINEATEIALGKRPRDRAEDSIILVDGTRTQQVENAYSSLRRMTLVGFVARMVASTALSPTKVVLEKNDYSNNLSLFNELDILLTEHLSTPKEPTNAPSSSHDKKDCLGTIRRALQDNPDIKAVFKEGGDGLGTWTIDLSSQRLGQNVKVFTSTSNGSMDEPTELIQRIISLAKQFEDRPGCSRYLWIVPDASRQFAERVLYLAKTIFHERPDHGSERTRPWPQLIETIYYGPVSGIPPLSVAELSEGMTKVEASDYARVLQYADSKMREIVVENRGGSDLDDFDFDDDDDSRPVMDDERISRMAAILSLSAVTIACTNLRRERKLALEMSKVLGGKGSNGIFLQYMLSRLCGIERKARVDLDPKADASLLYPYSEALHLAVLIAEWEDIMHSVRDTLEPSPLVAFMFEVAAQVGQANRVLRVKGMGEAVAKARWLLFWAAKRVLEQSMAVLGLVPVEEM